MDEVLSRLVPLVGVWLGKALEVSEGPACGVAPAITASTAFNWSSRSLLFSRLLIKRCSYNKEYLSGSWPTGSQWQGSMLQEDLLSCSLQQVSQVHLDSLGKLSENSQEPGWYSSLTSTQLVSYSSLLQI